MIQPAVLSPHTDRILQALQHQGQSNDCAPYTIATLLNGLRGVEVKGPKLAREMDRPVWRGPRFVVRRIPNWATFPWGMVDVLRSNGLQASWRILANPYHLLSSLPKGRLILPILHSWRPLWSHVMTLLAWDAVRGWGFANTQYPQKQLYWVPDNLFLKRWRALGRVLIEARDA